jgi:hypothetical protein
MAGFYTNLTGGPYRAHASGISNRGAVRLNLLIKGKSRRWPADGYYKPYAESAEDMKVTYARKR